MSDTAPWTLEAGVVYSIRLPRTSNLTSFASNPVDGPPPDYHADSTSSHPLVQILRHSKSPVGPFDALLLSWPVTPSERIKLPPNTPFKLPRVTLVYCSTFLATIQLRRQFHLPAHLASFNFSPLRQNPSSVLIQVSLPSAPAPFFATVATPLATQAIHLPRIPPVTLVQPPLRAGEYEARSHSGYVRAELSTITTSGTRAAKFFPALVKDEDVRLVPTLAFGDGKSFVDCRLEGEERCLVGSIAREVELVATREMLQESRAHVGTTKTAKL